MIVLDQRTRTKKFKPRLMHCCWDMQKFIGLDYIKKEDTGGYRALLREWSGEIVDRVTCIYMSYCPFCGRKLDG